MGFCVNPNYGRRATTNNTTDNALKATDYAISTAGAFGARTTEASLALSFGQLGRLAVAPQTVNKPINTGIKAIASVVLTIAGEITGEKRMASAFDLIVKGVADFAIKE